MLNTLNISFESNQPAKVFPFQPTFALGMSKKLMYILLESRPYGANNSLTAA